MSLADRWAVSRIPGDCVAGHALGETAFWGVTVLLDALAWPLPSRAPPIHLSWVMLSQPGAWDASAEGAPKAVTLVELPRALRLTGEV